MAVTAYPLTWPPQRPRTPAARLKDGKFSTGRHSPPNSRAKRPVSVTDAIGRVQAELDRIGARSPVLSTNLELRLDGLPRSSQAEPADRGAALYFQLGGKPHCLPCDTYKRVADNIAAIAAHIEATRAIARHGVASVAEMFAGFRALPAPGATSWWGVLQIPPTATRAEIEAAFRRLAAERHPDKHGGSNAMMADLNAARDQALKATTP
jgi:hypothetical protein